MTLRFLLDSSILVEPLRRNPSPVVLDHLRAHETEIATAAVVWQELCLAAARLPISAQRSTVERYLDEVIAATIPMLDYTARAAEWHASEGARILAAGRAIDGSAAQFAAIAAVHGLTIATLHRSRYALFHGLTLADWSAPARQSA